MRGILNGEAMVVLFWRALITKSPELSAPKMASMGFTTSLVSVREWRVRWGPFPLLMTAVVTSVRCGELLVTPIECLARRHSQPVGLTSGPRTT